MGYFHSITVSEIVNLTNSTISVYEESTGDIRKFEPVDIESVKFEKSNSTEKQYVVDCRFQIFEIIAYGCDIDNISILEKQGKGRGGKIISYLVWARDPRIKVKFLHKLR